MSTTLNTITRTAEAVRVGRKIFIIASPEGWLSVVGSSNRRFAPIVATDHRRPIDRHPYGAVGRVMKIKITATVDIDPDVWALEFGLKRTEVRKDVQEHLANMIYEYCREYQPEGETS